MYVATAGASLFTYLPPAFALWADHGHTVGFPQSLLFWKFSIGETGPPPSSDYR